MSRCILVLSVALLLFGCAQTQIPKEIEKTVPEQSHARKQEQEVAPRVRQTIGARFSDYIFSELDADPSECDSAAISDKATEWICAGYSYNYLKFIEKWEQIYSSSDFQKQFALKAVRDWMYFYDENGGIDFYGKGYSIQNNQILVAFDPSELGREIFVGVNPKMLAIFQGASGHVAGFGQPETNSISTEQNAAQAFLPNVDGSYNCKDFKNQNEAIAFFKSKGFSASYDPYGLDADNIGIPCESGSKSTVSQTSKCPSGKSWVAPYKRKNGTRVRGHCRKRR